MVKAIEDIDVELIRKAYEHGMFNPEQRLKDETGKYVNEWTEKYWIKHRDDVIRFLTTDFEEKQQEVGKDNSDLYLNVVVDFDDVGAIDDPRFKFISRQIVEPHRGYYRTLLGGPYPVPVINFQDTYLYLPENQHYCIDVRHSLEVKKVKRKNEVVMIPDNSNQKSVNTHLYKCTLVSITTKKWMKEVLLDE